MANHKSALKRARQSEKRNVRNVATTSKIKTLIKKVYDTTDAEKVETVYKEAVAVLDRSSVKGHLPKNNASRKKAALTKHVNQVKAGK
ncbi:MAG: 30S ribosomal protein S20 [Melioribacteraceae bacterium]